MSFALGLFITLISLSLPINPKPIPKVNLLSFSTLQLQKFKKKALHWREKSFPENQSPQSQSLCLGI